MVQSRAGPVGGGCDPYSGEVQQRTNSQLPPDEARLQVLPAGHAAGSRIAANSKV